MKTVIRPVVMAIMLLLAGTSFAQASVRHYKNHKHHKHHRRHHAAVHTVPQHR